MKEVHKHSLIQLFLLLQKKMKLNLISGKMLLQKVGRKRRGTTCCIMWVIAPGEDAGMDFTTTEVCVAVCDWATCWSSVRWGWEGCWGWERWLTENRGGDDISPEITTAYVASSHFKQIYVILPHRESVMLWTRRQKTRVCPSMSCVTLRKSHPPMSCTHFLQWSLSH